MYLHRSKKNNNNTYINIYMYLCEAQRMKGKREVKMEVCMRLEGCSVPPGCCEAGPVKGELQTKVFYSSGANGDK